MSTPTQPPSNKNIENLIGARFYEAYRTFGQYHEDDGNVHFTSCDSKYIIHRPAMGMSGDINNGKLKVKITAEHVRGNTSLKGNDKADLEFTFNTFDGCLTDVDGEIDLGSDKIKLVVLAAASVALVVVSTAIVAGAVIATAGTAAPAGALLMAAEAEVIGDVAATEVAGAVAVEGVALAPELLAGPIDAVAGGVAPEIAAGQLVGTVEEASAQSLVAGQEIADAALAEAEADIAAADEPMSLEGQISQLFNDIYNEVGDDRQTFATMAAQARRDLQANMTVAEMQAFDNEYFGQFAQLYRGGELNPDSILAQGKRVKNPYKAAKLAKKKDHSKKDKPTTIGPLETLGTAKDKAGNTSLITSNAVSAMAEIIGSFASQIEDLYDDGGRAHFPQILGHMIVRLQYAVMETRYFVVMPPVFHLDEDKMYETSKADDHVSGCESEKESKAITYTYKDIEDPYRTWVPEHTTAFGSHMIMISTKIDCNRDGKADDHTLLLAVFETTSYKLVMAHATIVMKKEDTCFVGPIVYNSANEPIIYQYGHNKKVLASPETNIERALQRAIHDTMKDKTDHWDKYSKQRKNINDVVALNLNWMQKSIVQKSTWAKK